MEHPNWAPPKEITIRGIFVSSALRKQLHLASSAADSTGLRASSLTGKAISHLNAKP